ncbi:unnamed protein product, partial [Sphagnum balticum]
ETASVSRAFAPEESKVGTATSTGSHNFLDGAEFLASERLTADLRNNQSDSELTGSAENSLAASTNASPTVPVRPGALGEIPKSVLRETGPLPIEAALPIIKQVCAAVAEAHRVRVIHRDLKPDNIILQGKDAASVSVKVVDFGVAKLVGDDASTGALTVEGKVCGSPAYMSPEQCRGAEFDYRCDIYSLGVVIFEMLTGKRPFLADDLMALMFMHVNETPPRMAEVEPELIYPEHLEKVVIKALSKNPAARQQSADELWAEVEE